MSTSRISDPWQTAASAPGRMAVADSGESATFAELVGLADAIGQALAAYGIADGEMVSTSIPPSPAFFALALAALRYGYGLFPVYHALLGSAEGAQLIRQSQSRLHISHGLSDSETSHGANPVGDSGQTDHLLGAESITLDALLALPPHPPAMDRAPAQCGYLAFVSSGTTGAPTLIVRARPWYRYRGVAVFERYAAGPDFGPHVMASPTFHFGTLSPALYALQAGSGIVIPADSSVDEITNAIDYYSADSTFLSTGMIQSFVLSGRWARHIPRVVMHGGSSCPPAIKRKAIELMGDGLREFYGTSEGIISEIDAREWLRHPGSVGRPLPGVQIYISDGQREVAPATPGRIMIRPRRVDNKPGSGRVTDTGDIGYIDDGGYLHVLGRGYDVGSITLACLEHRVRMLPAVTDVAVMPPTGAAAAPPRGLCYAEAAPDDAADIRSSILQLAAETDLDLDVDVRPPGYFPRTASGKISRKRH